MTTADLAAIITNARDAGANGDYLAKAIVRLADERDAALDRLETEEIECMVARRMLTADRASLDAAVNLLRRWVGEKGYVGVAEVADDTLSFLALHPDEQPKGDAP